LKIKHFHTVSTQIERRRSIEILDSLPLHYGHFWLKNTVIFGHSFLPKMTIVLPKSVPWRSNQEWRSICADTVYSFNFVR